GKATQQMKVACVVNESDLRPPGKLNDLVLEQRDSLREEFLREIDALHHFAGLQPDLAQRRAAVQSRAFIQKSVMVDQSLSECCRVVRKHVHDFEGVFRRPWA